MPVQPRAILLIGLIGACGLIVGFQGWRERGPDYDVVASMVRTAALVERGHVPQRGNLTDRNSFRPPGTSWLLVPGVVLFDDPRLVEIAGGGMLYLAALTGVFLLAQHFFSARAAVIASLIYAFSTIAVHFAGVLQPRAHPAFVVWMTYCAAQWVARRDGRWLAGSLVVFAAGMYVHLEMAPFGLMLPAIWWRYRPPVARRPLMVAAAITIVMWSPYLAFQAERDFADLGSQLLLRRIDTRGPIVVPNCGEEPLPNPQWRPLEGGTAGRVAARFASIPDYTLANASSRVPAGEFALLALTLAAMVVALVRRGHGMLLQDYRWITIALAIAIVVADVLARWTAAPVAADTVLAGRRLLVWLVFAVAVVIAVDPRTAAAAEKLRASWRRGGDAAVLGLALVVPAVVLLVLSEPDETRVLGAWPLQAVAIAGIADAVLVRAAATRPWIWTAVPLIIMVAATNAETLYRVRDWRVHGWSGVDRVGIEGMEFRSTRCEDER